MEFFKASQHITILEHNDDQGREFARKIAAALCRKVSSVKILALPGLPQKGDVSEWLQGKDPIDAGDELSKLDTQNGNRKLRVQQISKSAPPIPVCRSSACGNY